ncbi:Glycosyltransferase AglJ [uncultured archaeon]|nr:Glycosyltransferase AglJ [uncultured archaeon]
MADSVSIVIPALNEEEGIRGTIASVPRAELAKMGHNAEIIVVDGNSKDRTAQIARENGARVIVEQKRGYGLALRTGFDAARGDVIISSDADHTYAVEDIPAMLEKMEKEKLDFLSTNRFEKMAPGAMSGRNRLGNRVLSGTARLLFSTPFADSQSGMWLMKRGAWEKIREGVKNNGMAFSQEIKIEAFRQGLRCGETPVRYGVRKGEVKLNPWRDGIGNLVELLRKRLC